MKTAFVILIFTLSLPLWAAGELVEIPSGSYMPFVLRAAKKSADREQFTKTPVKVDSFFVDRYLVSNADFLKFVKAHPEWRRSKIKRLFADTHYLRQWKSDVQLAAKSDGVRPVTDISWFAARAYCESHGMDLPTTDQWEYILFDHGRNQENLREKTLSWYSEPTAKVLAKVGSKGKNGFGVYDLSAIVWEWTLDFNSFLAGDELRSQGGKDAGLFCGGGSLGMLDNSDYAAFMRYSFRASLKANYTTGNLGFRCVKEKGSNI